MNRIFSVTPLYFVTDHHYTAGRTQVEVVRHALEGGIRLVQYRDKELDIPEFIEEAKSILQLCHEYGAILLLNDRVEIAKAIGADGVHLGQDDMLPLQARTILGPQAIIGFSTHNEMEVQAAQSLPIDYINIGPMFPTQTKDHSAYPALGLAEVVRLAKLSNISVTTMGGIKKNHLQNIFAQGLKVAAMVSEISMAENIPQQVKVLLEEIRFGQEKYAAISV